MQDVLSQVQMAAVGAWQKAIADQMSRTTALFGRIATAEATGAQHAITAIDEWSKLMKESLAYQGQLAAEWRKLSLEMLDRVAQAPAATETTSKSA